MERSVEQLKRLFRIVDRLVERERELNRLEKIARDKLVEIEAAIEALETAKQQAQVILNNHENRISTLEGN